MGLKLKLPNGLRPEVRQMLVTTFVTVSRRLGIECYNREIVLGFTGARGIGGAISASDDLQSFRLRLNPTLGPDWMINAFCHELVHVRQYCSGALKVMRKPDGEPAMLYYNMPLADLPYEDQPWEHEAFGLQQELYEAVRVKLPELGPYQAIWGM